MLQESDLSENSGKREEYEIEKPGWKMEDCKCLGTLLDTNKDVMTDKIIFRRIIMSLFV